MIDIPPASVHIAQCRGRVVVCTVEMAGSISVMYSRQQGGHNTAAEMSSAVISHIIVLSSAPDD